MTYKTTFNVGADYSAHRLEFNEVGGVNCTPIKGMMLGANAYHDNAGPTRVASVDHTMNRRM